MLDLRLIRYFVAVAETEHVGRAAERLHISQSPLSRQIRQLEEQLGLQLFDRDRQRVRLTHEGRWLLGEARELLARAERIERDAERASRGEMGRVAIGFVKSAMWSSLLPAALRRFRESRPGVRVELRAARSTAQAHALLRGDLDLGLVHVVPHDEALSSVCLLDEPFILAVPKGHPLGKKKDILPSDLDGEPWVALSPREYPEAHQRFLAACGRAGFLPSISYDATEGATMLGLVEAGMGLALLQASARTRGPKSVLFRELPWFPISTRTHLVWRSRGTTPLAEELAETLRQGVKSEPQ